jgi:excisionase family DNA binding protein
MNIKDIDSHPILITSKELAEILGVSANTLTSWRIIDKKMEKKPRIPFLKLGNKVRYKLSDIKKFIESNESNE